MSAVLERTPLPPNPAAEATAFLQAVESGNDTPMLLGNFTALKWPVSKFLTDCSAEDRALLFKACHLAMTVSNGPNSERAAVMALRAFVTSVAVHYGEERKEV